MIIALDAVGGDSGPAPNVDGAIQAVRELGCGVILVGPEERVRAEVSSRGASLERGRLEIEDAPDLVSMDEDPARACRDKPRSSIMVAADLVSRGRAQAVVSAGHSGAAMVAALLRLRRLPGVLRPAIACPIPTLRGSSVLLDGGANVECKPWHFVQFAVMGVLYARHALRIPSPTVGILSNGEEESKGTDAVREAIPLLRASGLDFRGPVEGRDVPAGTTDVVVCDGFAGNVCLKAMEGTASAVFSLLKAELAKRWTYKLGGLLIRRAGRDLKNRMSYEEYGGAPLLGVDGTMIICHGKSGARAIFNAHRVARDLVESGMNRRIREELEGMKASMETEKAEA